MPQCVAHGCDGQAVIVIKKKEGVGIAIVHLYAMKMPLLRAGIIVVPEEVSGPILGGFEEDDVAIIVYRATAIPLVNVPLTG